MTEKKIWKRGLSVLLVLQIIIALSLVLFAIFNFPSLLLQFGMKYNSDMGILQLIMIYNIFLSISICLWSLFWIKKGNIAGIQAGTTVGLLIFLVSFAVFIKYDRVDMLIVDSIRAFLMLVFGILAYKEFTKNKISKS